MPAKLENHLIEYRVRPVTRYIVTRYESFDHPDGREQAPTSGVKGEFDNFDTAYQVGYALARDEHQRLGWPIDDERIKYPEPPEVEAAKARIRDGVQMAASENPDYVARLKAAGR